MDVDDTHTPATPTREDELGATLKRQTPLVGAVISGRYRLEAMLAAGGMGEVYRAVHVELGRPFALKLMRPELSQDPNFVERFRREAMTASKLGHPNIVDIIDSGRSENGQFYFVMEFLDGRTLTSILDGGAVFLPIALDLTTQIARALEVAHRAGVVHRDLKPDNVIVLERGGAPVVKVVDFGIAKVVAPTPDIKQTTHGVVMGTPQYMAPEQAAGVPLDQRADIYALGLILFELLTGKQPLTGATAALVMSAHIATPAPELPATFAPALRELVARMLAKRPGDRPASMTEVLDELDRVPREVVRPKKGVFAVIAVASVVLGGLATWLLAAPRDEPRPAVVDAGMVRPAPAVVAPAAEVDAGSTLGGDASSAVVDAGREAVDAGSAVVDAGTPTSVRAPKPKPLEKKAPKKPTLKPYSDD